MRSIINRGIKDAKVKQGNKGGKEIFPSINCYSPCEKCAVGEIKGIKTAKGKTKNGNRETQREENFLYEKYQVGEIRGIKNAKRKKKKKRETEGRDLFL